MKRFKIITGEEVLIAVQKRIQCLQEKRDQLIAAIENLKEQRALCCYDNEHVITNNGQIVTNNGQNVTLDIEL